MNPLTNQITTVGALAANDIGSARLIVQHEGSTLSGILRTLSIDTETINDTRVGGGSTVHIVAVRVTVTIGSITLGPLSRDHACEVIA